jgi:hypothetical protein
MSGEHGMERLKRTIRQTGVGRGGTADAAAGGALLPLLPPPPLLRPPRLPPAALPPPRPAPVFPPLGAAAELLAVPPLEEAGREVGPTADDVFAWTVLAAWSSVSWATSSVSTLESHQER